MKWWEILLGVTILALVVMVIVGSVLARKECEAKGGVFLSRDWVCAKSDAFIK